VKGILIGAPNHYWLTACERQRSAGGIINEIISMAFVSQQLSGPAKQTHGKLRMGSTFLPCFSKIPLASKPFFSQWYIHAIDITRIMGLSKHDARLVMQQLRKLLGKSKRAVITVDEFCAFTAIPKGYVRMYLVSRVMEHELKRLSNGELSVVSGEWAREF
jgi:hypothetical protein